MGYGAENQEFRKTGFTRPVTDLRDQGDKSNNAAKNQGYGNEFVTDISTKAGNPYLNKENGLDREELYGLNLEESKRQRTEAQISVVQNEQIEATTKDPHFSNGDDAGTSSNLLAKLAPQASQPQ